MILNPLRNCLIILFLFSLAPFSHSQVVQPITAPEAYRKGELALLDGDARQALRWFERAAKMQPDFSAARRGMGVCFELLRDYEQAARQYEAILTSDTLFSRALYYQAGDALYKSGEHKKALEYFRQFQALQKIGVDTFSLNTEKELQLETEYLRKLEANIRACEVTLDSLKFINITDVANLGASINSRDDDYFPFLTNDQEQLFFTRKTDKGDEDLYESRYQDGQWSRGASVRAINSGKDEGMCTLVRDGRHLYFTACGREGVLGVCDIWEALVSAGGEITEVGPLPGYANSEKWESQACISCDGSTLFFSSQRPGGLGRTDLWVSYRDGDGKWSTPQNLGATINTAGDEEAPFITNDGTTLYFSSTGHPGMGDQDIFMSWKGPEGRWSHPINLGPPVNSAFRELGFFLTADGHTGYFASDRPGGKGKLDIYSFELDEQLYSQPITFVEGIVIDSVLDVPVRARVSFDDRLPIEVGRDGRFFLCIPAWDTLGISVDKTFFQPYSNQFIIPQWDNKQFYTIEILLRSKLDIPPPAAPSSDEASIKKKKKTPTEFSHTIYFGFDKTMMELSDQDQLQAFLVSLKDKMIQQIDIIGFADDIGTEYYNLKLSEERAKQIALFLMDNGLEVNRIYLEGKGELTGDLPKELYRRVEIRILTLE